MTNVIDALETGAAIAVLPAAAPVDMATFGKGNAGRSTPVRVAFCQSVIATLRSAGCADVLNPKANNLAGRAYASFARCAGHVGSRDAVSIAVARILSVLAVVIAGGGISTRETEEFGWVGACSVGWVADTHIVALVARQADDWVAACASAGLARVRLGTEIIIVAARAIRDRLLDALAAAADPSVALVAEAGAVDRRSSDARALLAGFQPVTGVAVVTDRAVVGIGAARCAVCIGPAANEHPAIAAAGRAIGIDATIAEDRIAVGEMIRQRCAAHRDDLQIARVIWRVVTDGDLGSRQHSSATQSAQCGPAANEPTQQTAAGDAAGHFPGEIVEVSAIHDGCPPDGIGCPILGDTSITKESRALLNLMPSPKIGIPGKPRSQPQGG